MYRKKTNELTVNAGLTVINNISLAAFDLEISKGFIALKSLMDFRKLLSFVSHGVIYRPLLDYHLHNYPFYRISRRKLSEW